MSGITGLPFEAAENKAHDEATTIREAALALGLVTEEQFDAWVQPGEMIGSTNPDKTRSGDDET